ncbi:MAG: protein kinase domain-containing protein, partial [Candidatus Hydrogenedentota bacterium]
MVDQQDYDAEAAVPTEWTVGDVILERYEVTGELGVGGMGKVFKVHDRSWDMDLAVKTPKASSFQTETQKENFLRECHTWMDLGLHNHIVTCHYVRVLGGLPRVFADYVDGGSLKDWIDDGALYEGGTDKALERILDIAIQFGDGLHYAHEKGLIHQDIKPANVMMTADGAARLTDFGLANARAVIGESGVAPQGASILASYGGMTPAYCSPEQADNAARRDAGLSLGQLTKLTRRTDVYSWAVSVLELFNGGVMWQAGNVADHALESYLEHGPDEDDLPEMPKKLAGLLRHCLQQSPDARPHDMNAVADALREVYELATGQAYVREAAKPAAEMADVLNNKALSFLELNPDRYGEQAEALWREALVLDAHHLEATYNLGLHEWRTARIPVDELIRRMEETRTSHPADWRAAYLLGLAYIGNEDKEKAERVLSEAAEASGNTPEVRAAREQAEKLPRGCVRVFDGHEEGVTSVYVSADGRWALSGSWDNTLRLWDVSTGNYVRVFKGHTDGVTSVCLSADGRWALSGSGDKTLRLWDVSTGNSERMFKGHEERVTSVCLSADTHWALSGSEDKTLRLWDVSTGDCVRVFQGHTGNVESVCLSTDAHWGVSSSSGVTIRLWNINNGKCVRVLWWNTGWVNSVCLSGNGRWALSGNGDNTLQLWEVQTGHCERVFQGHEDGVSSVDLSGDGKWALSGSADKTLRLWDTATGHCERVFQGHMGNVTSVHLSPDGRWMLSGSADETLRLWEVNLASRACRPAPPCALAQVATAEAAAENERRFRQAVDAAESALTAECYKEGLAHATKARTVPGRERIPEALDLWNRVGRHAQRTGFQGGWHVRTFEEHTYRVTSVCLSGDGRWVLSGSADKTLRLWDAATGHCVRVFQGHEDGVSSVDLSGDGKWALSGSRDKTLRLWDTARGHCVRVFQGHEDDIASVCFSTDGRWALSGSGNPWLTGENLLCLDDDLDEEEVYLLWLDAEHTMRFWEITTGKCVQVIEGHKGRVESVCLSADQQWALSGSGYQDNSLRFWDIATGECVFEDCHTQGVNSVCISI